MKDEGGRMKEVLLKAEPFRFNSTSFILPPCLSCVDNAARRVLITLTPPSISTGLKVSEVLSDKELHGGLFVSFFKS
jgi:hypothetical protein